MPSGRGPGWHATSTGWHGGLPGVGRRRAGRGTRGSGVANLTPRLPPEDSRLTPRHNGRPRPTEPRAADATCPRHAGTGRDQSEAGRGLADLRVISTPSQRQRAGPGGGAQQFHGLAGVHVPLADERGGTGRGRRRLAPDVAAHHGAAAALDDRGTVRGNADDDHPGRAGGARELVARAQGQRWRGHEWKLASPYERIKLSAAGCGPPAAGAGWAARGEPGMAGHDGRRGDLLVVAGHRPGTRARVLANGRCIMGIINSDNGDIVRVECRSA